MTDAIDTPTRRARRETHTGDTPPPQHSDIIMPNGPLDHPEDVIVADKPVSNSHLEAIKFAEDPVMVILNPSNEENEPQFRECWVNGRGIEFLTSDGKWRPNWPGVTPGYAPIGVEFTTKRKYVEILIRASADRVKTIHEDTNVAMPVNRVSRTTARTAPMSVISDASPKGRQWLTEMLRT